MTIEGNLASPYMLMMLTEPTNEQCTCSSLSPLRPKHAAEDAGESAPVTPVTPELGARVRQALAGSFPRVMPLSVLLLHVSQLEHIQLSPKSAILHQRLRYHASTEFLEQVLATVRRTIRQSDQVMVHGGTGAAIIFPGVDQEGAFGILERVYYGINLLQSETVVPPLTRETDIFIGMGSYPEPASTLDELLLHTGNVAHRLTLRPAVTAHLVDHEALQAHESLRKETPAMEDMDDACDVLPHSARSNGIPFMQIPTRLPARLKHLIPYQLACELRCAPVGRDHNRLTVAMAHPTDSHEVSRLQAATSMAIYPVSCEITALDTLLASEW